MFFDFFNLAQRRQEHKELVFTKLCAFASLRENWKEITYNYLRDGPHREGGVHWGFRIFSLLAQQGGCATRVIVLGTLRMGHSS